MTQRVVEMADKQAGKAQREAGKVRPGEEVVKWDPEMEENMGRLGAHPSARCQMSRMYLIQLSFSNGTDRSQQMHPLVAHENSFDRAVDWNKDSRRMGPTETAVVVRIVGLNCTCQLAFVL